MKIDVQTGELFTDDGALLKKLECPLRKRWASLQILANSEMSRFCEACKRDVHDTSTMSDSEVAGLLEKDPETCLLVSTDQDNVRILPRRF